MSAADGTSHLDGITVEVLGGEPTDLELAALIAVVSEAYVEEAQGAVADEPPNRSAWALSQRSFREPLRRELGWVRGG
ncbi:acyl-CoA carboxylase subunit epsilon [Microbacterium sp. SS28]|uniref:acyl-CoA carboxylase subunit epsilon n=1 Tax=Microbacterium sp. SS28 TaxID=2919948 RepID=UPI001FAA3B23|nr:acyl-CoA carboxylase subunit epsilon [Microbacterium sp. SS28]